MFTNDNFQPRFFKEAQIFGVQIRLEIFLPAVMCALGLFWASNSKSRVSAKIKISRVKIFEKNLQNQENFENLKIDLAKNM